MLTLEQHVRAILPVGVAGQVSRIAGLAASVIGFPAPLGATCRIDRDSGPALIAEVVGFRDDETLVLPYGDLGGVRRGNRVTLQCSVPVVRVGERLLGRVLDGYGRFIDGLPAPALPGRMPLYAAAVSPLDRPRIKEPLETGIRAIDALLTCGKGQRLGIFAGSGVGKSVLLGQIARSSSADVNVIVLVGERGREVREFLEKNLGANGLARSVVVVATSDEPALLRLRAAWMGTTIAEYFRETGRDVLLMMDSITRCALAQREIGLASGEPPATRGYPPSVFAMLPRLLERSGCAARGSITGLYTVLVEADDANEPISDSVRGILDGHVMLSRKLAHQAHWPAIDVLSSVSRVMPDLVSEAHRQAANQLRQLLAAHMKTEDLLAIGAYQPGSNALVDAAVGLHRPIVNFLQQHIDERPSAAESVAALAGIQQQQLAFTAARTAG